MTADLEIGDLAVATDRQGWYTTRMTGRVTHMSPGMICLEDVVCHESDHPSQELGPMEDSYAFHLAFWIVERLEDE